MLQQSSGLTSFLPTLISGTRRCSRNAGEGGDGIRLKKKITVLDGKGVGRKRPTRVTVIPISPTRTIRECQRVPLKQREMKKGVRTSITNPEQGPVKLRKERDSTQEVRPKGSHTRRTKAWLVGYTI